MYPTLEIFTFTVSSYHAFLFIAFIIGAICLPRVGVRGAEALRTTTLVILPVMLGALFGAKLLGLLLEAGEFSWREAFAVFRGPYYLHGGWVGGMLGYAAYLAWGRNNTLDGFDAAAPCVALGESVTRVGCFLSGCCWGRPTDLWLAVQYPPGSHPYHRQLADGWITLAHGASLPVHPAQLYAVATYLLLAVLLLWVARARRVRGEVFAAYLLGHSVLRLFLEQWRADMPHAWWGLTATQIVAIFTMIASAAALAWTWRADAPRNAAFEADTVEAAP